MKCTILLFFYLYNLPSFMAQSDAAFVLQGTVVSMDNGSSLKESKVNLTIDDEPTITMDVDKHGAFEYRLRRNADCLMVVSHDGYVSKSLVFNTEHVPEEFWEVEDYTFPFRMNLSKNKSGQDVSVFEKPVARIIFDAASYSFVYDKLYLDSMKLQQERYQKD